MGTERHLEKITSQGLLRTIAFALGALGSCEGVSEDPLAGEQGGNSDGGAVWTGAGGSSGLAGSADVGGSSDESMGGHAGEGSLGGDGGVPTPVTAGAGGAAGDGDGGDAGSPPKLTRCSSTAPFGTPQRVLGLPTDAVRLRLNPSETVGYYARYNDSQTLFEIEVATRSSRSDAFSTGTPINTNDGGWDFSPALSADGSVLYFESRDQELIWRIHQSMWDPKQQAFGPVVVVSPLGPSDGQQSDGGPYTLPSGDVLYFHSNRSGNGSHALFRAQGVGTSFAQVAKVPITFPVEVVLATTCPVVMSDELTIYFASHESNGRSDIWMATRETKDSPFAEATPVVAVNTASANEVPSFISKDGCRLYLDRNSNLPFHWGPPAGSSFVAEREPDME